MAGNLNLQLAKTHEVEETPDYERKVQVIRSKRDKDGKHQGFYKEEEVRTGGYMVYMPGSGTHSFHVDSLEKLHQLGLDLEPQLVDLSTGEVVPEDFLSVKSLVKGKTKLPTTRK